MLHSERIMDCLMLITGSSEETEDIGFKLGTYLKTHGGAKTVCLFGELGAGKTTFIKGIASAFNIPKRDISSASFVIVAEYETSPPFYHIDLYRLEKDTDVEDAGIWEYIESDGIAVIEWAERLDEIPENAVKVRINLLSEESREIIIEGINEKDWNNM
ncbi:MAG: tRNA (adenosine(37)-N6)-threonylcarbamoyltransferase complex ATPase subunit type 1 TsaE [Thermodesulfovibrio sp.]|nr:tRNA (adenosine(37)-N6)-threonylcarbamoyltransferase complex ATPase subunit type 1 TsaE [Thermodesulfovibrio sp.]